MTGLINQKTKRMVNNIMELKVTQILCPQNKYSIKCPYDMDAQYITIHNTANDASAMSEISYMLSNNREVSFHYAVDDERAVQGIPTNRNAWHCTDGNGVGNRQSIGIEICYSKSGGDRFLAAEKNAAFLTATLLKERGWGIDRVRRHQDWYSRKNCPHRTIELGWQRFLDMVSAFLSENGEISANTPTSSPVPVSDVFYRVRTKEDGWLPPVKSLSDYAGWRNHAITDISISVPGRSIKYRVHTSGRWLPYVTGYNINDYNNGFAGIGKSIDAIEAIVDGVTIQYRVQVLGANGYYPWQNSNQKGNGMDGYAGVFGRPIVKFQAHLI